MFTEGVTSLLTNSLVGNLILLASRGTKTTLVGEGSMGNKEAHQPICCQAPKNLLSSLRTGASGASTSLHHPFIDARR